jgi:hypothetical protein
LAACGAAWLIEQLPGPAAAAMAAKFSAASSNGSARVVLPGWNYTHQQTAWKCTAGAGFSEYPYLAMYRMSSQPE